MKTSKFNREQLNNIGRMVKKGGKYLFYGVVTVLSCTTVTDEIFRSMRYSDGASYSDAIGAIMDSDMLGSYKDEAVSVLTRDGDEEFYKAIIHVVNSNMLGSHRVDTIKKMCDKISN